MNSSLIENFLPFAVVFFPLLFTHKCSASVIDFHIPHTVPMDLTKKSLHNNSFPIFLLQKSVVIALSV